MNDYFSAMDDIIKLLEQYKKFTEESKAKDLRAFGRWLSDSKTTVEPFTSGEAEVDGHGIDAMISYLMGGLIGYVDAWLKLSYKGLPVVSLIDFGILKTVQYMGQPSKSEVAANVIAERTTTIESIKRMTQLGLMREKQDKQDKRMKRVGLTEKGRKMILILDSKMIALGHLLVGDLSEQEKIQLAMMLKKLNHFHQSLYKENDRSRVKTQYNL